jgi:hypothetical protein
VPHPWAPGRALRPQPGLRSRRACRSAYECRRHHERLDNLAPADVYFGRGQAVLRERERIKRHTIGQRRPLHQRQAT